MIRAHRTQGVALGYHLAPRWGKRPLDRVRWIILPRSVVAKDPWGRTINHRTPTAPKGQNEIAQGRAKRRPGYISALISAPLGSALSGRDSITPRNRGRSPSDRVRVVVGEVDHDWDASELLIMRWLGRTGPKGISHSCMLGSLFDPVGMLQSLCLNRSLGKFFCCSLNQRPHHDRN
jgi:hypothetical protein